ncbi:hypothetical protein [Desulfovibrio ferrophilus]|uniref:Uncharacterized protein n=1 Tax=Desulfovibrio ferrophilus TaxID=241368 RepID=A0A2Z6B385_9BACT|nr:hypothetical protein [Desulfovibrio ferrophilus]BBD09962.1 uncharacterized protein DFE_3236 [Desulfovibrio ferrophilus]
MEVGWYLRLSRAAEIVVLVQQGSVPALEEQCLINPPWTLESVLEGEHARVVFKREKT